jgi:hypothetical protein
MGIVLGIALEALLNTTLFASKVKDPEKLQKAEQTLGLISGQIYKKAYWKNNQKDEHISLAGELSEVTGGDYRVLITYICLLIEGEENKHLFYQKPLNAYREPIKFHINYLINEFRIDTKKYLAVINDLPLAVL